MAGMADLISWIQSLDPLAFQSAVQARTAPKVKQRYINDAVCKLSFAQLVEGEDVEANFRIVLR